LISSITEDYLEVVTIDPCPRPVIFDLEEPDYWHFGWLTMLINVSDLAAMGATPLGILISTIMPPDMRVCDYERFLDGLHEASINWACPVLGGNIKDGTSFSATGSAIGRVRKAHVMRRTGAARGDYICSVGPAGLFWTSLLAREIHDGAVPEEDLQILREALRRPTAFTKAGTTLAETGLVTACTDASDGLGGAMSELAMANRLDFVLQASALQPHASAARVAKSLLLDPRKLSLTWGDWQLVFTVSQSGLSTVVQTMSRIDCPLTILGQAQEGTGGVYIEEGDGLAELADFKSSRFSPSSSFSWGLEPYRQMVMTQSLTRGVP
jgi:thiamine-monophosphate kinase